MSEIRQRHNNENSAACAHTDGDDRPSASSPSLTTKEVRFLKRQARKRKWVRRLQKCNNYAHALCKCPLSHQLTLISLIVWMSLSGLVIYKTNFFRQLWDNPEVNSFFLNIALGCTGFLISVLLYMSIYGPCFFIGKKRKERYDIGATTGNVTISLTITLPNRHEGQCK